MNARLQTVKTSRSVSTAVANVDWTEGLPSLQANGLTLRELRMQVRQLDPSFGTAEWGFALGSEFWESGLFANGADMVIDFSFDVVGAHRLEARAAVENTRGNAALRKLGAIQEGILRKSFLRGGKYFDQALWAITDRDSIRSKAVWGARVN